MLADNRCLRRRSIAADLKKPKVVEVLLNLLVQADVLIERFHHRVTERLWLGPVMCSAHNPKLI